VLEGTPAYRAGFSKGDEVLSIGDKTTPTWETVAYRLMADASRGETLSVRVRDADGYEQLRALSGDDLADLADNGGARSSGRSSPGRPRKVRACGRGIL